MKLRDHLRFLFCKLLGKNYPCGRSKKDSYLCCMRNMNNKNVYYSEDRTRAFCKYCGRLKILSNHPLKSVNDIWE
jgi:hypothetical protein